MSQRSELWKPLSINEEKALDLIEAITFCNDNRKCVEENTLPAHLIKRRCRYISVLIAPINPICSEYCSKACNADTYEEFTEYCTQSIEAWNKMVKLENEKKNRTIGIV